MYHKAKAVGVAEVKDTQRCFRDFIMAIEKISPVLAQRYEEVIEEFAPEGHEALLFKVIEKFRNHIRLRDIKNVKSIGVHSAFPVGAESNDKDPRKPSFRNKQKPKKPCPVCGTPDEWLNECNYVNPHRAGGPGNSFVPDPEKKKKTEEALKDPEIKKQVDRAIKKGKEYEAKKKENANNANTLRQAQTSKPPTPPVDVDHGSFHIAKGSFHIAKDYIAFVTIPEPSTAVKSYKFRSSWLLDSGSDINVCNETMKDRFTKERDCNDGDRLLAGTQSEFIAAWGRVKIWVDTPTGRGFITITNVIYVPNFATNLISTSVLEDKGLHFFPLKRCLTDGEQKPRFFFTRNDGHYVLEDNSDKLPMAAPTAHIAPPKSGTSLQWHQLLAHAGGDAIQRLTKAVEGVEVTDSNKTPTTNQCEVCAHSKAHRIVSRSPFKAETSDKPFYRITYDLIELKPSLNGHRYVSHIACESTEF